MNWKNIPLNETILLSWGFLIPCLSNQQVEYVPPREEDKKNVLYVELDLGTKAASGT